MSQRLLKEFKKKLTSKSQNKETVKREVDTGKIALARKRAISNCRNRNKLKKEKEEKNRKRDMNQRENLKILEFKVRMCPTGTVYTL